MVEIRVEGGKAIFELEGTHKLWALKSSLTIPLAHIRSVHVEPDPPMGLLSGVKLVGTDVPHFFKAGAFYQHEDKGVVFWDVRHADHCIGIELEDEHFKKLYLEVESPESAVKLLADAVRRG